MVTNVPGWHFAGAQYPSPKQESLPVVNGLASGVTELIRAPVGTLRSEFV